MDELMAQLKDTASHTLRVPRSEETKYKQLIASARRHGRVPEGMQLTTSYHRDAGRDEIQISLEPLPAWRTKRLAPIAVPTSIDSLTDVVSKHKDSSTFPVVGTPRERALRLLDGLVHAARDDGMKVKAHTGQPVFLNSYGPNSPRQDETGFKIGQDEFRLWFTQASLKQPHEPTPRELARARRGYVFPDFDTIPDDRLGIAIRGDGGTFWASDWKDTDEDRLEEHLAQILEEFRLRHAHLDEERTRRAAQEHRRQLERDQDRAQARDRFMETGIFKAMENQASQWVKADDLRRYAEALRQHSALLDIEDAAKAREWANQIAARARSIDPLSGTPWKPRIPEPTDSDLKPFTKYREPF
ncbi:hypothetical protein [Sinomonas cellulolyticus]|uniref:PE-PGRS family protein n=1 Tax=Sinomonas cellulolyticus TaxID=2801916 RepID=A0ABS1K3N3_9MICC|nr:MULTISPECIES: hypothetical protein [Sinomonas]MBL0706276.1 hypothetical protein [Sinomonas cellulolyticus]